MINSSSSSTIAPIAHLALFSLVANQAEVEIQEC